MTCTFSSGSIDVGLTKSIVLGVSREMEYTFRPTKSWPSSRSTARPDIAGAAARANQIEIRAELRPRVVVVDDEVLIRLHANIQRELFQECGVLR